MKSKILGLLMICGALLFSAFLAIGDYEVTAADTTVTPVVTADVPEVVSIKLDSDGHPLTNIELSGPSPQDLQSGRFDVVNEGNVPVNIYVRSNGPTISGPRTFNIADVYFRADKQDMTNTQITGINQLLTNTAPLDIPINANPTDIIPSNHLATGLGLHLPLGSPAGEYSVSLTYTGSTI
ncbi:MAG: hypothetical protein HZC47_07255 [Methanobacterium sp.]|uniref:hypothetical protein n=1 Tax=Methanobacterium sp. TaxID=2164 RepID=UPI003D6591FF|nr:hypothetical protein [Methanobacterium sp.]